MRPACALLLVVAAACGTVRDEGRVCPEGTDPALCGRPLELPYLTEAIFAPSCAQSQCHSSFRKADGLVFDEPDKVRRSLLSPDKGLPLLAFDSSRYDPQPLEAGDKPALIVWLTDIDPFSAGIGRMPFDAPLASRDIELLEVWIRAPQYNKDGSVAVAGGFASGAQCDPELYLGNACNLNDVVTCGDDFNFGEVVETCANGCVIGSVCDEVDANDTCVRSHREAKCQSQ